MRIWIWIIFYADIDPDNFAGVTSNVDPNSSNANMDLDNLDADIDPDNFATDVDPDIFYADVEPDPAQLCPYY